MSKHTAIRALKRQMMCETRGYTMHVFDTFRETGELPGMMTITARRDNKRARRWGARP